MKTVIAHIRKYLTDRPIRLKMFYACSLIVLVAVLLVGAGIYYHISLTIEENIENELSNATATILNMVETTAKTSIRNYLRAVAEKNLDIVSQFYTDVQYGRITEAEAKLRLREILFSQTIGSTGYIYCLDSKGMAVEHPNPSVENVNFAHFPFIQEQIRRKEGYLEYEWKNPGEDHPRPKALYMTYFAPWDWIISVSSYRSEFTQLINISDFKDSILALRFGKTGYSYVLDSKGDIVVHPLLTGNLWNAQDANGFYLVRHQCETRNGKLVYSWRNPGETHFRDKIVIYNDIREYDWIVASTGYLDEFHAPLKSVRNIVVTTVMIIVMLVLPATFKIAGGITRPLRQLESHLSQCANGNFTGRMAIGARDEIGNLALYYNEFMNRLETYSQKIQTEIAERRKTEELFSKAFQASPSGMFIWNLQNNRLIDANQSFLDFIGCRHEDVDGKPLGGLPLFQYMGRFAQLTEWLKEDGRVRDMDIEFINAQGQQRLGVLHAETVHIWGEQCVLCAVEDLSETQRLEREIIDISERERLQLGQYLHDDLCSHLLGIEVMQKVLRQKLAGQGYTDLKSVDTLRDLVQDAIDKTGRISRGLCPTHIAEQELELTLRELCRDIEQIHGVTCRLEQHVDTIVLNPAMATHIYYIAREAAYNAVRHGKADHITLRISRTDTTAVLQIIDDGVGFLEPRKKNGMGIRIMHYRARRIGATLKLDSKPHEGTRVTLCFSLIAPKEENRNENPVA